MEGPEPMPVRVWVPGRGRESGVAHLSICRKLLFGRELGTFSAYARPSLSKVKSSPEAQFHGPQQNIEDQSIEVEQVIMSAGASSERVLKRVRHDASDGRPSINYRIQLVDQSLVEDAIRFMTQYFLPYENINSTIGVHGDAEAMHEAHAIWRKLLSNGISLAAFLEDDTGNRGQMISCNILDIARLGEEDQEFTKDGCRTEKWRTIFRTLTEIEEMVSVFWTYKCQTFVHAFGLAVATEFERRGVGGEMLRAREDVCRLTNIPVSATVFTGAAAQRLAQRSGWKTLAQLDLTTFLVDGQIVYPQPQTPIIKLMAIQYF